MRMSIFCCNFAVAMNEGVRYYKDLWSDEKVTPTMLMSLAQRNLWGETLTLGELTHDIGINYNSEHFGFGIMMVNPFSPHGSRTVTKDLSALAPTSNTAVMQNYRQVLMLNFNFNLDFGSRASTRGYQRINNEDTESGILSGTK